MIPLNRTDALSRERTAEASPAISYTVFDGLQWNNSRGLARFAHQLRQHLNVVGWQERPASHPRWTSAAGRVLIGELIEPLQQLRLRPQIAFYPHNVLPAWLPAGDSLRVLVLHDVLFLEESNRRSAGNRYRRLKLGRSLAHTDVILTVSETSRALILPMLEQELKVLVIPNCLAGPFAQLQQPRVKPVSRTIPTILHFGGHAPSKNTRVLIEAVAQLIRSGNEVCLEIAAMYGQAALVDRWRIASGLPARALRLLPLLSDAELIEAYRRADVHAMPSTGEGFGIPVIEAARSGTVNVLTPLNVFREMMGDAAIYASGFDTNAITEALRAGLAANRTALAERSFARTGNYVFDVVHEFYAEPALESIAQLSRAKTRRAERN